MSLLPFSAVQNQYIRKHFDPGNISYNTFMKYMHKMKTFMEHKMASILPQTFALVFDRCSAKDTHFVGIFATFSSHHQSGYDKALLGC